VYVRVKAAAGDDGKWWEEWREKWRGEWREKWREEGW
jgi:hypothetical protein